MDSSKQYVIERFKATFQEDIMQCLKAHEVMISGGLWTSAFTGEEVNDVDCYFKSKEHLVNFLKDLDHLSEYNLYINSVTDKSMTVVGLGFPLQLIYFQYFDKVKDIFKTFDFTINMCGWDCGKEKLYKDKSFFADLAQKRLRFNKGTAFPLISALRVDKYKDRGYEISRSEMLKILLEVSKLKLDTKEEFIKHVGGMYGATILKRVEEMPSFSIDATLKLVSESNSEVKGLFEQPKENPEMIHTSIEEVLIAMVMKNPKYSCFGTGAYELVEKGVYIKDPMVTDLMKIFHPKGLVKAPPIEDGIYYKWVRPTEDPNVFKSIYDETFTYTLNEDAEGNDNGMYALTADSVHQHHYKNHHSVILACEIKGTDFLKFDGGVYSNKLEKFAVSKLKPLYVVDETEDADLKGGSITCKFIENEPNSKSLDLRSLAILE